MNKSKSILVISFFLLNYTGFVLAAENSILNIKVRNAKVRSAPKNWAGAVAGLRYGDSVEELSKESAWFKVKTKSGTTGYLHESAVTTQRVVLATRNYGADSYTGSSEVVLAGKGFSRDAEKQLAQGDSSLNFRAVDFLEQQNVSDAELAAFIKSGKLNQQG